MTEIDNAIVLLKRCCDDSYSRRTEDNCGFVFYFCVFDLTANRSEVAHHKSSKEPKSVTKSKQKQFWHCCVIARHPISLPSSFLCLTDRSEVALNAGCLFIIRQHNEILLFDTWRGIRPRRMRREAGFESQHNCVCEPVCVGVYNCGSYSRNFGFVSRLFLEVALN